MPRLPNELPLPNERLELLGLKVRLGVWLLPEPKRLPNERPAPVGWLLAVVRVLLSRGVPNERLPLLLGAVAVRLPNERLAVRSGLSFEEVRLRLPNERLPAVVGPDTVRPAPVAGPAVRFPLVLPPNERPAPVVGPKVRFCGPPVHVRRPGS